MSVLLTDERAHVLERRVSERSLRAQLDHIYVAPGFVYSEDHVGTNAIGTALAQHFPSVVDGAEHFADPLTEMACAAAPVTDPLSGRIVGIVDLTCWVRDASNLMLPVVRRAASDIERRLADDSAATGTLLRHFLLARRRARGAVVALSRTTMLTNAAAARLVHQPDHDRLWAWASQAISVHDAKTTELRLASGMWVRAHCEAVRDDHAIVGCLLRLDPLVGDEPPAERHARGRRKRVRFGWASLTATERGVADVVARGMTNREAAAELFLSPHTVDYHLRQIFRKLGIRSRVELARLVSEHSGEMRGGAGLVVP